MRATFGKESFKESCNTYQHLQVPLNYSNPDTGSAAVAVILYPSNVTSTDPGYRGPLLLNPGGPGGSGVDFLRYMDPRLREGLFGTSFDLISFDPRGTPYLCTISLRCMLTRVKELDARPRPLASTNLTAKP